MSRPADAVSSAPSSALPSATATAVPSPTHAKTAAAAEDAAARVESFKKKAAKAFRDLRYTAAAMHLSDAIAIDPSNHTLYSNRSAAFAALSNYPRALSDANKCISLAPSFAKGYFRAGHALEYLHRFPEALARLEQGLALDPSSPELQIATASLRVHMSEVANAAALTSAGGDPSGLGSSSTAGESKSSSTSSSPGVSAAAIPCASPAAEADSFARMVSWLEAGGATFPHLFLKNYKDGFRGVHASTHIPPDSLVLFVPRRFIMTSEVARASAIGRAITDSRVELRSKHSYIAAYLLQERDRGAESFWAPYLAILPKRFDSVPLFFADEELKWLEGSFTVGKVADRIESLQAEYESLRDAVPSFSRWTFDDFAWARVCVITRIFGFTLEGIKTDGLVPYADMLNHKLPRETRWQFERSCDGFTITSITPIERGAQVFDSYGQKSNTRFFINYGFTVLDNPEFEAVLRVEIPENDPLLRQKLVLLSRGGAVVDRRREYQVPCDYTDTKARNLFAFARIAVANEEELRYAFSIGTVTALHALSARNEAAALALLAQAARTGLARFPSGLAVDHDLLLSGELEEYSNLWNSVVVRRGEKVVLEWFSQLQRDYSHVISAAEAGESISLSASASSTDAAAVRLETLASTLRVCTAPTPAPPAGRAVPAEGSAKDDVVAAISAVVASIDPAADAAGKARAVSPWTYEYLVKVAAELREAARSMGAAAGAATGDGSSSAEGGDATASSGAANTSYE